MFEQRILCHELPSAFNSITLIDNSEEQCVNKRQKMIQDLKRQILHAKLEQYELKIQHYEHLYEQALVTFQSEIYKIESLFQTCSLNELMHCVNIYVYQYTKLSIRQIRYKESCFRVKLLRHHRRYRSRSSNKTIDVYPQIIAAVPKVSLSKNQLDYLSRTGKLLDIW
jgi:hypothetical protein